MATERRSMQPGGAATRKPFAPAGPLHWGYPFTVEVAGEAGDRVRAFLDRFTRLVPATEPSGYAVVDAGDTETAAAYFQRNRPVVNHPDFLRQSGIGLDTARWWDAPLGRALRVLSTYGLKVGAAELKPLTRGPGRLVHLKLENAWLKGASAGKALRRIGALHPLESLTLRYNELGPAGVAAMFAGGGLPALRALDLSANELGDAGIAALARSPGLGNLRWLSARSNATKELIARLDGVETLPVARLDLANLRGGETPAWAKARFLRSVTHLRVEGLEGQHLAGFLASGNLDRVEVLVLGGVYAQPDAAHRALCEAEALPYLRVLSIHGWRLDVSQAKALCASNLVRALEGVDLMASGYVSPEAARVFLDAGVRVVTSPEFNGYVANDIRSDDFAYEDVAD